MQLKDLEDLINFAVSTEKWSFFYEFGKDASDCPDVYSQTVLPLAKQDLRSPVPKGLNLMSEGLDGDAKGPCKSKICDLENALVSEGVPLRSMSRF